MDSFLDAKIVFSLLAAGGCLSLILFFKNVEKALLVVLVISIPFAGFLPLIKRGGRPTILFSVTDIALFLLLILWVTLNRNVQSWSLGREKWPQLLYVLAIIPSIFVSGDLSVSLVGLFRLVKVYLFYWYIFKLVKQEENMTFLINCLLGLNVVVVTGIMVNKFIIPIHGYYGLEVFGKQNWIGGLLSGLALVTLGALFMMRRFVGRISSYVLFIISIVALIVNESRGAWVSFAVSLMAFCILGVKGHFIRVKHVAVIAVVTICLGVAMLPYLKDRLGERFQDASAQSRIPLMKLSWEVIKANPIVGVGLGNYRGEMKKYRPNWLDVPWMANVHNQYLGVWAETGTIGLFFFLFMLISTLRKGFLISKYQSVFSSVGAGFVAAIMCFMVHNLFDAIGESSWFVWGSMAIISALFRKKRAGGPRGDGETKSLSCLREIST